MADNVDITPGAGATVAADEIASVKYQRMKLTLGADGVNDGDVSSANPMPVGLSDRSTTGTISALNGTVSLAVDEMANAAFHITGSFVARYRFEKTVDGTNWEPCYAYVVGQNDMSPSQMPWDENWSNNIFLVTAAGAAQVRVIATGYTSGTITVTIRAESASSHIQMAAPPTSPYLTVYDDFEGSSVDTLTWEVVNNTGVTVTVSSSQLTVGTNTTSGNKYTLLSRQFFGPGMRAGFYMSLSQRIANQRFRFELVSINENGAADEENIAGIEFTSTTATAATRRNRAQNGADDTGPLTIATSATISYYQIELYDNKIILTQTTTAGVTTQIGIAIVKVPDPNRKYKLRIEAENTGTAASNTNMIVGHARFQSVVKVPTEVMLSGINGADAANALPVRTIYGSGTQPVSGTVTASGAAGAAAHDAAISGNPLRIAGRALTANYTAVATGDTADLITTLTGSLIVKQHSIPDLDWQFACSAAITNTSDVAMKAAAGAGIRNYVTGFQVINTNATATEIVIKDGSSVIWRGYVGASMLTMVSVELATPLRGSANTAVNFACITTGASVYVNAQGYASAA